MTEEQEKQFNIEFPKIMGKHKVKNFPRGAFEDLKALFSKLVTK